MWSTTLLLRRGATAVVGTATPRTAAAATSSTTMTTTSRLGRRWMGGGGGHVPVPQSQHAPLWHGHSVKTEGWETSMYFYAIAAIILQVAVVTGAPETSIESWARAEAQARLKLADQGFTDFEFGKHYQDIQKKASLDAYDKFAIKAVIPGEDDEDEEEEEEEEDDEEEDEEVCAVNHIYVSNILFCTHNQVVLFCFSPFHSVHTDFRMIK